MPHCSARVREPALQTRVCGVCVRGVLRRYQHTAGVLRSKSHTTPRRQRCGDTPHVPRALGPGAVVVADGMGGMRPVRATTTTTTTTTTTGRTALPSAAPAAARTRGVHRHRHDVATCASHRRSGEDAAPQPSRRWLHQLLLLGAGAAASAGVAHAAEEEVPHYLKTPKGVTYLESRIGSGHAAQQGDFVLFDYVLRRANGYFIYGRQARCAGGALERSQMLHCIATTSHTA